MPEESTQNLTKVDASFLCWKKKNYKHFLHFPEEKTYFPLLLFCSPSMDVSRTLPFVSDWLSAHVMWVLWLAAVWILLKIMGGCFFNISRCFFFLFNPCTTEMREKTLTKHKIHRPTSTGCKSSLTTEDYRCVGTVCAPSTVLCSWYCL